MLGKFGNDYCKVRGALKTATPVIELKQVSPGQGFLPAIARGVQGSPSKRKAYWTCCEELFAVDVCFLVIQSNGSCWWAKQEGFLLKQEAG